MLGKTADNDYVPNEETIKVLEESRRGIGVNMYSSWEEMFSKILQELKEDDSR